MQFLKNLMGRLMGKQQSQPNPKQPKPSGFYRYDNTDRTDFVKDADYWEWVRMSNRQNEQISMATKRLGGQA